MYCNMHRLSLALLEDILIKSVGGMFDKLIKRVHWRTAADESLTAVNSVCLPWWNVLTGRNKNKCRLRRLLDGKSA